MKRIKSLVLVGGLLLAFGAAAGECSDHLSNQRYAEALAPCTEIAEEGYAVSQYNLGVLYDKSLGVPQDYKKAAEWYTKAAEQGFSGAQHNLALMYDKGKGVPQDYKKAVDLYRKAAEQGYALSQYNLGVMYYHGQGVPQDIVSTYAWWNVAAAQGHEDAAGFRDLAAENMMTPSQLEKGQELSREYFKKYVK